jgi:vitamin-K-epoxide reductase (warfarin-sensitive)
MRYFLAVLALAGLVVSYLAFRVHYSNEPEICSINEKWDCGMVNHSPYAVLGGIPYVEKVPGVQQVPVAALGIFGYVLIGVLAIFRRKRLVLVAALAGLGFALYLTHVEKDILMVYCVYCVTSLGIISLISLSSLGWLVVGRRS